jgi:glycosyltransferase involved in cell wall biosynthesis
MGQPTIVISINAAWNIFNFRRGLIAALLGRGYRVVALAPPDEYVGRLEALGVEFHPIAIDSKGTSPWRDFRLFRRYLAAFRAIRPDLFLGYTVKPNVYGSMAAHLRGIPVINNVAGLGTAFIAQGLLTRIVSRLYRVAFRRSTTVFFQNPEDLALFLEQGLVRRQQARLLPGSGVDLEHFAPAPDRPRDEGSFGFLLASRLLWDKGVGEYVEAARLVREIEPRARFGLLGFLDVDNRTAVPRSAVDTWVAEGIIEFHGASDDVRPYIADSDCVVLPSYREGMPRILLEAGAMARPMIASDVPGCRQAVVDGENGLLCAARDAKALADAMLRMIRMPAAERAAMGRAARALVEKSYDERAAIGEYLAAVDRALVGR